MLLLQVIVFTLVDISSSYKKQQECYGSTYTFTPTQGTTSIYYKPRNSDERILVFQGGESKHERFEASLRTIKMKDLTEQDDGAILFFDQHDSVQLAITDCRALVTSYYGDFFSWKFPSSAEYMEFAQVVTEDSPLKPLVIWNRTNPSSSRGKVKSNYFEIYPLKQKDSGYYKFRGSKNELLQWRRLRVEENYADFKRMEGDDLDMDLSFGIQLGHIEFLPKESDVVKIIKKSSMRHRMDFTESYFTLRDLKYEDSGTYRFVDDDGFVAVRMQLNVTGEIPTWAYFVILAVIVLGILICCCCVKKCCCKKSERNSPGSAAGATPPVYYHGSNQPAQTAVTLLSIEPRRITADATMCDPAGGIVDPPPSTQVTVTGSSGLTSLIGNSSDFEPTFELKRSVFSSAPPLSSDTSIQDVYTSDKLNFL